jgi:hypothetical protein
VVSAACCLLRIFYKGFAFGFSELGYDDYAVLAATVMGVPTVIIIDKGIVTNGLAQDVWTVPFDHITNFVRWLYILEILYFLLIAMVKLALLFFFLRIFPKPTIRRILWAFSALPSRSLAPSSVARSRITGPGGTAKVLANASTSMLWLGPTPSLVLSWMSGCWSCRCTKSSIFNYRGAARSVWL